MDENQRARALLGRAISDADWHPTVESDDGLMLRSMAEMGWVELLMVDWAYHATVTPEGHKQLAKGTQRPSRATA